MSSWQTLLASTLVILVLSNYAVQAFESEVGSARTLLQKQKNKKTVSPKTKKDKEAAAEKKREQEALAAYAKQQAAREKEKAKLLRQGAKQSQEIVADFNNAESEKEQIKIFVDLWKNSAGVAILQAITTLVSSSKGRRDYYIELFAESIQDAISRGYAIQVSSGVASALTIVERESDGAPLLNAILLILRTRNKARKNSGCVYVKNLMSDAEVSAIESGYENEFTQTLDEPRYTPIMECFLDACVDEALDCCKDRDSAQSGVCGCNNKEPRTCSLNVFWRQPRIIWRCSGPTCVSAKCLCPVVKQRGKAPKTTPKPKAKSTKPTRPRSGGKTSTKTKTSKEEKTTTTAARKRSTSKGGSSKGARARATAKSGKN